MSPRPRPKAAGVASKQQSQRPAQRFGDHQDTPRGISPQINLLKTSEWIAFASPCKLGRQYNLNTLAYQNLGDLHAVGGRALAHVVRHDP